jgi:hypothetical protein
MWTKHVAITGMPLEGHFMREAYSSAKLAGIADYPAALVSHC